MKKIIISIIFLFGLNCFSNCFAQIFNFDENDFIHFSIEPNFSYTSGTLNEYIYRSANKNKKISLLEWERKLLFYGINTQIHFKKFQTELGFSSSFPNQKSGRMHDSDWQNPYDYSMKTTYSVGTNNSDKNYDARLSFLYNFEPFHKFFVTPEIQFQYMYDSFFRKKGAEGWYGHIEEKNGSQDGKYHWWNEPESRKYPYTDLESGRTRNLAGIDYERHSFYLWTGFSSGIQAGKIHLDLKFMISPFTYFYAEDRHHTSREDNVFHEIQSDFFTSGKFSFNFSYEFSKHIDFVVKTEHLFAKNIKGDLYDDWSKIYTQPSGASSFLVTAKVGLKIKMM